MMIDKHEASERVTKALKELNAALDDASQSGLTVEINELTGGFVDGSVRRAYTAEIYEKFVYQGTEFRIKDSTEIPDDLEWMPVGEQ